MNENNEIGQDFFCLVVGIMVAVFSTAGVYTIKFLWDRKEIYFRQQRPADQTQKTLKFQTLPSVSTPTSEQDQDKKNLRASMSPFSLAQHYQASKSGASDSRPREVEVTLDIKKGKDTDQKFDVDLRIIVDPDSDEPLNVKVDAQVDRDTMSVLGKAYSEADGSVNIEGQAENDKKKINLRTKGKNKDLFVCS